MKNPSFVCFSLLNFLPNVSNCIQSSIEYDSKHRLQEIRGLIFVQVATLWNAIMTMGKDNKRNEKQKSVCSRLVDSSDLSSPYRAMNVLDELQNQLEEDVRTLADIPDLCLERFLKKETIKKSIKPF